MTAARNGGDHPRRRIGAVVGGSVAGLAVIGWAVLLVANRHQLATLEDWSAPLFLGGLAVVWSGVGALLVRQRPRLVVGWLFLLTGLIAALDGLLGEYAARSVEVEGLPGGIAAAWMQGSLRGLTLAPIALLLLLYPNGRPCSPRWRWMRWCVVAAVPALAVPTSGGATQLANYRGAPVGIAGVEGGLGDLAWLTGAVLVYPVVVAGAVGLVLRYRRGTGVERQQLKWAGLAGLVALFVLAASTLPIPLLDDAHHLAGAILVYGLPVCVALAVLRHGMYDIDRVISRTVAYALVALALTGLYLGAVLGLGAVARTVTGESGDLVVALSTLAVAAVARPLLARVRAAVDRRFDRARYDAARTVDAFGRELRDEVSRDAVVEALRATARTTLAPALVGVHLIRRATP